MATTHKSYYERVRRELNLALCVQNFPCQNVERHNKPEVEFQDSPELVLPPVEVTRNDNERVLIERSVNSVSVKVKQADELEEILCRQFMRFLTQRAEAFKVLRRVLVPGYDVSFLVTHEHVEDMLKPNSSISSCSSWRTSTARSASRNSPSAAEDASSPRTF